MPHGGRRKGAGRPPARPKEKRSKILAAYLTPAELASCKARARAAGLDLASWHRAQLLGAEISRPS